MLKYDCDIATYIAEDSNQNWISCWDGKEDDIRVENYCSNSNDVVLFGAGQSNQSVRRQCFLEAHSGSTCNYSFSSLLVITFFLER